MESSHIKRRHRELSKQQAIYVANRERGVPRIESAILAGYKDDTSVTQIEKSPVVSAELERARRAMAKSTGVTRDDIAKGLMDAAEMARTMADPAAMVRAFSELGKLLGHYAAEKKTVEHELGVKTREALKAMTDAELHRIAQGRVIEGESKDVSDAEPAPVQ